MKMEIRMAYGNTGLTFEIDPRSLGQVIAPRERAGGDQRGIVRQALEAPINSPSLRELSRNVKKILIITNDKTRPLPSRLTLPLLLDAFYYPQTYYDITILIATGLHRGMTEQEKIEKFGEDLCKRYAVVNHDATDAAAMDDYGRLSTGTPLYLNKLLGQNELVIAEGFIEPHFFAGFSGGRKSILPGVAGAETILGNHRPQNIADPAAAMARLKGNPIHEELMEALDKSPLRFILNVALNGRKEITAAFAGHPVDAHAAGCGYVREAMSVACEPAPIVVASNNGYPLDRNLYQAVKGLDTACRAALPGGPIILAARCVDGVGHGRFREMARRAGSREELYRLMNEGGPEIDKWQLQILARVLRAHPVFLVSEGIDAQTAAEFFLEKVDSIEEGLERAFAICGRDAKVNVVPDGPVVIPQPV